MLLERIRLQGFLSHYGTVTPTGVQPVELDFTEAPLWLIHGDNGAGKSAAAFDSITFAFYRQHRGGGKGFDNLIHHEADRAVVEVEFSLCGTPYLVKREIRRNKANPGASLYTRDGDGKWKEAPLDGQKVEDWVQEQLRMPYDTFVATVLLRQGQADTFLNAKATARRELLLKLINLEAYRRLEQLARSDSNESRKEAERLAGELDGLSDATEEAVEAARAGARQAKERWTEAEKRVEQQKKRLEGAEAAAEHRGEIAKAEEEVKKHEALLADEERIRNDAQRHQELATQLPRLDRLHDALTAAEEKETMAESARNERAERAATLPPLEEELATTSAALAEHEEAVSRTSEAEREAVREQANTQAVLDTLKKQLVQHELLGDAAECPTCGAAVNTPEGRERVASHFARIEEEMKAQEQRVQTLNETVAQAKKNREAAAAAVREATAAHNRAERALAKQRADLERIDKDLPALEEAAMKARAAADARRAELPEPWAAHPAASDQDALAALEKESKALAEAPKRAAELAGAHLATVAARGRIATHRTKLDALPEELRDADLEQQKAILAERESEKGAASRAHEETILALGRIEEKAKRRAELATAHDEAVRRRSLMQKLATAFGPTGLQARILRDAQVRIRNAANNTLRHLTGGMWEIELIEDGDALDVLARDHTHSAALRAFEYLSGGERFRVAVALAVGIGQSVAGGRSADSLLIDEGFGALDDSGRVLMVEELRRLSEDVLGGGRVIVVSHQEDVQDQFPHRHHVTKGADGRACIERATVEGRGE